MAGDAPELLRKAGRNEDMSEFGFGFKVSGLGFRVQGLNREDFGFRVQPSGLWFRVSSAKPERFSGLQSGLTRRPGDRKTDVRSAGLC